MANLSNINNKFLVTTGGNVLIGTTADNGSGILQLSGAAVSQYITSTSGSQATLFIGRSIDTQAKFTSGDVAASDLCLYTGGSRRLVILSSGYVGIGIDDPSAKLEVKENLYVSHPTSEAITFRLDNYGINGSDAGSLLRLFNEPGTTVVNIDSRSGSSRDTYFNQGGNFGIGTVSPNTGKLVVKGVPYVVTNSGQAIGGIDITSNASGANTYSGAISFGSTTSGRAAIAGVQESSDADTQGLAFFTHGSGTGAADADERMRITRGGDVGIGTAAPTSKLDVTNGEGKFCVDSKAHLLTNAFTTCLTVNLNSHTGCYVTLTCFGDWGGHSSAAYRGEFFLQNGANAYSEPGIILRQDDNTSNGTDQIVCQILDPTSGANPKDFEIQIRTTATTGTTSFSGQLTYTVQGKFNSIT